LLLGDRQAFEGDVVRLLAFRFRLGDDFVEPWSVQGVQRCESRAFSCARFAFDLRPQFGRDVLNVHRFIFLLWLCFWFCCCGDRWPLDKRIFRGVPVMVFREVHHAAGATNLAGRDAGDGRNLAAHFINEAVFVRLFRSEPGFSVHQGTDLVVVDFTFNLVPVDAHDWHRHRLQVIRRLTHRVRVADGYAPWVVHHVVRIVAGDHFVRGAGDNRRRAGADPVDVTGFFRAVVTNHRVDGLGCENVAA